MRDFLSRIGVAISLAVNYPCWTRVGCFLYGRTENIYSITSHLRGTRPWRIVYMVNIYRLMGVPLDIVGTWAGHIPVATVNIGIIDNGSAVNNGYQTGTWHVIVAYVGAVDIRIWRKVPKISYDVVPPAKRHINADTGTHWRPAIVPAAVAPAYPSRSPFSIRDPFPAIIIIITPAAVVERRPAPVVVRHPGIPVIGIHPMAVGSVRAKIIRCIRYPNGTKIRVVNPNPIRGKFIVKCLERDVAPILGRRFLRCCQH